MTKKLAILFDLDDTLLINDMDHFLPGYINALIEALPNISGEHLQKALFAGTNKMLAKNMPANTLEETFNCSFYPKLQINKESIQKDILRFYKEEFPKLQQLTGKRPESAGIVSKLSTDGHAITIATSPLFPSLAQYHRLSWAGISELKNIDEVTSFENYHFCKPHPEYFIEVIIKNQYTHMPVVMIGNSLSDDIIPCEKLGIPTYWVTDNEKSEIQGEISAAGELSGVPEWIEKIADQVKPVNFTINYENSISLLKTTPAIFEHFYRNYNETELIIETNNDQPSIVKILRHIIEGDKQLNIPRIRQFYQENKPIITGMDLDSLSPYSTYTNNDYYHLISQFIDIRTELLELILNATNEIMNKQAMHTIFGPTLFSDIIQFIAIHDLSHLDQCYKILNHHTN